MCIYKMQKSQNIKESYVTLIFGCSKVQPQVTHISTDKDELWKTLKIFELDYFCCEDMDCSDSLHEPYECGDLEGVTHSFKITSQYWKTLTGKEPLCKCNLKLVIIKSTKSIINLAGLISKLNLM